MSTPSANPRERYEASASLRETLRKLNTPASPSTAEANDDAPQQTDETGVSGESSGLSPRQVPWKGSGRDDDVERLAASLRWLQREERATRFARTAPLAPHPFDAAPPGTGEPSEFRSPLSLEPQRLAPPPETSRSWPLPAAVAIACLVAAGIGYFVSAGTGLSPQPTLTSRVQASAPEPIVTAALPSRAPERVLTAAVPAPAPETAAPAATPPPRVIEEQPGKPSADNAPAPAEPAATPQLRGSQQPPPTEQVTAATSEPRDTAKEQEPSTPVRTLDRGDIELLMERAQQFVAIGDLVTARILFQRAAKAGDAAAAVALGATYDPVVLAKLGVVGISPDVEKARNWYRMAESLGSSEATRRLAVIANR